MVAESAIHVSTVYLAAALRFLGASFHVYVEGAPVSLLPRALLYMAVMLGIMTAFGLYGSAMHRKDREYHVRFIASFPAGAVVMAIIFYVIPTSFVGRGLMALSLLFSFIVTALAREVFFHIVGHDALKRRVLVLGSGSRAAGVEALLESLGPGAGFHLVGFVQCGDGHHSMDKSRVLGDCTALRALVEQHRVDEIVVGVRDRRNGYFPTSKLLECRLGGVSIVDLPTFFERETGYVQLNSLSATLPVMLLAALAIWHETGRPILYRQKRVGESGRVFEILKFRSMRVEAEHDGVPRWAKKDDDRVTRVGRFLRTMRIDELPQLINVLRGDMSFVG